jgi:hypothetical protein
MAKSELLNVNKKSCNGSFRTFDVVFNTAFFYQYDIGV